MALSAGTRLGPYEIIAMLGAGGMGEVYKARDPKLNRDVAIKILPDAFVHDPDRLARFQREAQVLAALNHPNIAAIYGLEESEGRRFLVLEFVDGQSLAQRLARGADVVSGLSRRSSRAIPVTDALTIARQIIDALDAAHDKGIVHRDLKPANIMLPGQGANAGAPIQWLDRAGRVTVLRATPANWTNPQFSPDGRRLAVEIDNGTQRDVWVYEWARDTLTRLTIDAANDGKAVWTPDGRRIVFRSTRLGGGGTFNPYRQRADGTGDVQRLTESKNNQFHASWHLNGKFLAFHETNPQTGNDLRRRQLPDVVSHAPRVVLQHARSAHHGRVVRRRGRLLPSRQAAALVGQALRTAAPATQLRPPSRRRSLRADCGRRGTG
ncbi:MAG: hypothetical protein A3G76_16440 [Acidobacteria bacterium RIFCSPLOWO2_12_FULL_65_11]|nr:MAG: hypothetical protein A3H95_15170 [Acidobacteria bacterium RIFCSPLOWO2_02_FULL_64_15]OFW28142.1 MAG: hypothetical protein A3G76_16440 [Acidobacteria bacterium RIFCSPLOWO2_12_FULL_65_11]